MNAFNKEIFTNEMTLVEILRDFLSFTGNT